MPLMMRFGLKLDLNPKSGICINSSAFYTRHGNVSKFSDFLYTSPPYVDGIDTNLK